MRNTFSVLLLFLMLLVSCDDKRQVMPNGGLKYASLLKMDGNNFAISDPWQTGKVLQSVDIKKPYRRLVVFTTSHCMMMEYLGVADRIVGVCDAKYILIDGIQKRLRLPKNADGHIEDCGSSMSPDVEKIVALQPDAIILSPYEGMGLGRLEKVGIPVILAADYMETSSLGRAEWIKYYGRLFGCEERADSFFNVVDSTYQSLKNYASRLPKGLSILTERKTGATWYTPGGASTIGVTIRDANGSYAFSDDKHSGSLPLSYEQILEKAGGSDVWAFKINGGRKLTKYDLLKEFHGYEALKAFRDGNIYECNCSQVPYFEEVSWRPDYLLREMIQLLHPGVNLGGLRYYRKL